MNDLGMMETGLTDEQLESLRQYANACKMRPNESPDAWRDVPTAEDEWKRTDDPQYWLSVANQF